MKHISRLFILLLFLLFAAFSFAEGLSVVLCIGNGHMPNEYYGLAVTRNNGAGVIPEVSWGLC